ncbi:MAG: BRO family protein [Amaricoccus sp.]|uniref:BRO-N domain-containing protein n=1 Tax=Amaricoccus sp. TaxID=1872485 RepID=UPI0039E36A73
MVLGSGGGDHREGDHRMSANLPALPGQPSALAPAFEGVTVRHVTIDGKAWIALADVCKALGLGGKIANHARRIPAEHKRTMRKAELKEEVDYSETSSLFPGRTNAITLVTREGAADLALDSRKPQAKRFRRWMVYGAFSEIDTRGSYTVGQEDLSEAGKDRLAAVAHQHQGLIAAEEREARSLAFDVLKGRLR